jgi:hypothetical protein
MHNLKLHTKQYMYVICRYLGRHGQRGLHLTDTDDIAATVILNRKSGFDAQRYSDLTAALQDTYIKQ